MKYLPTLLLLIVSLPINSSADSLRAELTASPETISVRDPLFLKLTVINGGATSARLARPLGTAFGTIKFYLASEGNNHFQLVEDAYFGRSGGLYPIEEILSGEIRSCYEVLFENKGNFSISKPGSYRIRADVTVGTTIVKSSTLEIEVGATNEKKEEIENSRALLFKVIGRQIPNNISSEEVESLLKKIPGSKLKDALTIFASVVQSRAENLPNETRTLHSVYSKISPKTDNMLKNLFGLVAANEYIRAGKHSDAKALLDTIDQHCMERSRLMKIVDSEPSK